MKTAKNTKKAHPRCAFIELLFCYNYLCFWRPSLP